MLFKSADNALVRLLVLMMRPRVSMISRLSSRSSSSNSSIIGNRGSSAYFGLRASEGGRQYPGHAATASRVEELVTALNSLACGHAATRTVAGGQLAVLPAGAWRRPRTS